MAANTVHASLSRDSGLALVADSACEHDLKILYLRLGRPILGRFRKRLPAEVVYPALMSDVTRILNREPPVPRVH